MTDGKTLIDTVDAPKLKPCPFCGAAPHRMLSKVKHDQLHGDAYQDTIIRCPHRCAEMEGSLDAVAERWNTRADLSQAAVEALEAKLAKAAGLLEVWIRVAAHCTIEEGVCCCGENMDTHDEPMNCGHSPVDHGAYVARGLVEATNALFAELTGGKDD